MNTKHLLQIHKSKLRNYISKGIICPDIYLNDDVKQDTQSKNRDFLIISDGYIDILNNEQVLLELILTKSEKLLLQPQDAIIYFLDKPLPITRIKAIYCDNHKQLSKEIGLAPQLFKAFPKGNEKFHKYIFDNMEHKLNDYTQELSKFDKTMGMFAFMKNSHLYYTDETQNYKTYPNIYFQLCNFKTNKIELSDWIKKYYTNDLEKRFIHQISSNEMIDKEFLNSILNEINDDEVKEKFNALIIEETISKLEVLKFLEDKDDIYYFIALIFIYGDKNLENRDNLKDKLSSKIPFEKKEYALAMLGLYYGYTNLEEYEDIKFNNPLYTKIQTDRFSIKLEMNSRVDYVLLEAIYQYSFNQKENLTKFQLDFSYLDELNIRYKDIILPNDLTFTRWYKTVKNRYIDVTILEIQQQKFDDLVIERVGKYAPLIEAKHKLFGFVYDNYRELIQYDINSKKGVLKLYFEKDIFIETIKDELDIKKQNKLLDYLDLDKK